MKRAGKAVVITIGNSGIGLATAREFVANGANVVIFGRNRSTLDQAVVDLGEDALAVESDVCRTSDLERLFVMAKAALYLASDDSVYCVGSEILVDGDLSQLAYYP
jgi:NADP-dependent 3-hydroxy acid dehydrogenase YdfG